MISKRGPFVCAFFFLIFYVFDRGGTVVTRLKNSNDKIVHTACWS